MHLDGTTCPRCRAAVERGRPGSWWCRLCGPRVGADGLRDDWEAPPRLPGHYQVRPCPEWASCAGAVVPGYFGPGLRASYRCDTCGRGYTHEEIEAAPLRPDGRLRPFTQGEMF